MTSFMNNVLQNGIEGYGLGGEESRVYGNMDSVTLNLDLKNALMKNLQSSLDLGYLVLNDKKSKDFDKNQNEKEKYHLTAKAIKDKPFILKAFKTK